MVGRVIRACVEIGRRLPRRGFRRSRAGNVLMMWAFFLIPLLAAVGSAVDIGRAYVARSQMQHACDAASLAGRRAMSATTVDDQVRAEALKFFNFDFRQGTLGAAPFTPQVTSATGESQTVVITAATTIPTTMMQIFGYRTLPIGVSCNAKQDFVNTDIVFVLDTTGSMDDKAVSTDADTKIVALRKAVLALFDQLAPVQTQLNAAGLRLRYGIVPYASVVNAGAAIKAANPTYMYSGNWAYQSRQLNTVVTTANACNYYYNYSSYNAATNVCSYFSYGARNFDTTQYVAGNNVDVGALVGTGNSGDGRYPANTQVRNVKWAGCVEERQTTRLASTATTIPSGAYDLDIDFIPNSTATRWKPYWPEVEYQSYQSSLYNNDRYKPQVACPSAAAAMKTWTRMELSNYLDGLVPDGGTYHDFGMMWGARWASSGGIFGPNNPETFGNMPVKKYIIFMTDGLFSTGYQTLYSGYGIERLDARVTPGGGSSDADDQLARHKTRFSLLCSKAKTMGYSVWVIGFATSLDTSLTNCASNASQASTSDNQDDLLARFVEIGKNIGALRLTQ